MGFPESFVIPVSDTQAYKQFGNSVVVPVVQAVAEHMRPWVAAPMWRSLPPVRVEACLTWSLPRSAAA